MPVTLVDRLPLPNLKVYTAGSVVLLAAAVYHAVGVASDPAWRANATLQRQEAAADGGEVAAALIASARNISEQVMDVITVMTQEPLCMWTVINMCYCALGVAAAGVQRAVFGSLRAAEAARVKEKLWNYVFYKFIFVFGVLNVQYMDEVLLWCGWFTLLGCLHLLAALCKDRYQYLSARVAQSGGPAHLRLVALLCGVVCAAGALLALAARAGLPRGTGTFAFMAAECVLVLVAALHVLARYALQLCAADAAGRATYYTHLAFDTCLLGVETLHVVHMVWRSSLLVSLPSLVLLLQLRHLLHELQRRLRRHRLYSALHTHMSRHYPMATAEEVEKNQDNCAICWEPMREARKLPCTHLFHNSCLCQWVQQDASCPTCRRALHAAPSQSAGGGGAALPALAPLLAAAEPLPRPPPPHHPNHLFHFDGSRYVSWLPSFSVEVTRVHAPASPAPPAPPAAQLDAMARQVQQLFPQYGLGALREDLASSRSADLTVNNILEGRLPPPPPPPAPSPEDRPRPATRTEPYDVNDISASEIMHVPPRPSRSSPPSPPAARDAATNTTAAANDASTSAHTTTGASARTHEDHFDYHTEAGVGVSARTFPEQAEERERALRRRRAELVAAARLRYQRKMAAATAAPSAPAASRRS